MKQIATTIILLTTHLFVTLKAQVPANYYSVNSWMPKNVGTLTSPCGTSNVPGYSFFPDGKFYKILNNSSIIQMSGVKLLRHGGTAADLNGFTWGSSTDQWDEFILAAQSIGAEPVIQIPFLKQFYCDGKINTTTSATNAISNYVTSLVTYIKNTYPNVKYYSIGNEPDRYDNSFGSFQLNAADIGNYFRPISEEIKTIYVNAGKPAPLVIGPDLAEAQIATLMPGLIGGSGDITGKITSITSGTYYFCDIYTYHTYPFNGSQSRNSVITHPSSTYFSDLTAIRTAIDGLTATQNQNLKIALTEFNINWENGANTPSDNSANSFIAGQWMAEMFATGLRPSSVATEDAKVEFMVPWSVHESSGSGSQYDLGLLNGQYISPTNLPTGRSTYYHLQMMAQNFPGGSTFLPNISANASIANVKAFACNTGSEIHVMIMNQNQTGGPNLFKINFDGLTSPSGGDINILIAGGNSNTYSCRIKTESTILLRFTTAGTIISRTEYSLDDAKNEVGPRIWNPAVLPTTNDVYIKDTPLDDGAEPNPNQPWHIVNGTDVWVRNTAAPATSTSPDHFQFEHQHESVEFSLNWPTLQSSRPRIYTKIRNGGCSTISGHLRLYYHKLSTSDHWNGTLTGSTNTYGNWEEILCGDTDGDGLIDVGTETLCGDLNNNGTIDAGETTITLQPGEEWVVERIWNNVAQTLVFKDPFQAGLRNEWCLLARFESAADAINGELNGCAANNAKESNNIVQKNVVFKDDLSGIICSPFDIGNYTTASTVNELKIIDESNLRFIENQGTLSLDLGKPLYDAWVRGGRQGSGIVDKKNKYNHMSSSGLIHSHSPQGEDPKPYVVAITSTLATLGNIQLSPKEIESICPTFNYFAGEASTQSHEIYFAQYESKNNAPMAFTGAVKYVVDKPNCPKVNAGSDVTVGKICTTTLTASPILEGATYIWRNNSNGITVGTGPTLVASPHVTTTYELEMTTPNRCIDYDVVTISVNPNIACQSGCGSVDYFNVTLSGNTVIDEKTVVVDGVLKVPNNAILTVRKSKLLFTENSGIEVMTGGKLVILNSELRPCDITKKWKGISIKGNNSDATQLSVSEAHFYDATSPLVMDKVNGANIVANTFDNGTTAITMDKCKNFTIAKNEFYIYNVGVYATNSILDVKSMINENYFYKVRISVQLENGNHTKLDIKCNVFEAYDDYAILSNNSTLKDQGNATEGAGNLFISNSTKLNDKLNHNGNSMKYYYDPSNPVSLVTGNSLNALAQPAATDGSCNQNQNARMADLASENAKEEISKDKMIVYAVPNPNSGLAAIYFNLGEGTQGDLIVTDIYGKVVDRIKINSGSNKVEVDYSQYANGVYLLSLTNSNGENVNKKMIIAK